MSCFRTDEAVVISNLVYMLHVLYMRPAELKHCFNHSHSVDVLVLRRLSYT